MLINFNNGPLLLACFFWPISSGGLPTQTSLAVFVWNEIIPDNEVVRVNLRATAAVQQDAGVSHNSAAPVMLVLHGGHSRQKTVEILGDVCGAVAIKNVVDDISRFQCALQNGDVSLGIKKSQNILPVKKRKHSYY